MNKKASEMRSSRAERRKNFNPRKWANEHLKDGGGLPIRQFSDDHVFDTDTKFKTMSNADRRRIGIEQDESLEDFDLNYKIPQIEVDPRSQGLPIENNEQKA